MFPSLSTTQQKGVCRGLGGVGATPQGFKRLCVMETEVTNRTEGPLLVGWCFCFWGLTGIAYMG